MTTTTDTISRSPMHELARKQLLARIGRRWRAGQRLPTVKSLSADLGIGLVNTHRAVQELVAEGYLTARPRVGIRVAQKHSLMQASRGASAEGGGSIAGRRIEIIMPERDRLDGMHLRMIEGFRRHIADKQCDIRERECLNSERCQSFIDSEADALVFINASRKKLLTAEHHVVVNVETGWLDQFPPDRNVDHVTVNQQQGGALAGHAFREAGLNSVCFLGCTDQHEPNNLPPYGRISAARLAGFESGWQQPIPTRLHLKANYYDESAGVLAATQYLALKDRPDGVFAASDELAVGFVHGMLAHGLIAGRDYQIIGFDAQQRGQTIRWGPLASVAVPSLEMGEKAAELLIQRCERPDRPSQTVALGCAMVGGSTFTMQKG